jgi:Do/DeqQ family serine protease
MSRSHLCNLIPNGCRWAGLTVHAVWLVAFSAIVVSVGVIPTGWAASAKAAPESQAQVQLSFAPVVKKAAPAVVNIYTRRVELRRRRSPLLDDPIWRHFFPDNSAPGGRVQKRVRTSLGSGVIVHSAGIIVTNVHVIRGAEEIRVVLADRREFDAKVLLADTRTDLAVLRIDAGGEDLPFIRFHDSETLEVGDLVLAIGNPFGVGQTVTSGIVSALARTAVGVTDYRFFIQTDAAINPGNSGGALVTMDGRLAGINTALFSRTGGSVGIGFAVPSAMVKTVVAGLTTGGKVVRAWFGAKSQRVSAQIAASIGLPRPRGVIISKVHPDGPAAAAGIQPGDVVTAVNKLEVSDPEALRFRFATLRVGGTAKLSVIRGGRMVTLPIALKAPPEVPARGTATLAGANPLTGARVANLSPAVADELSLSSDATGIVVLNVARGSLAQRVRLQPKDVIRTVNGVQVVSVAVLKDILAKADNAPRWHITFERKNKTLSIVIGSDRW